MAQLETLPDWMLPKPVVDAIRRRWPDEWEQILPQVKHNHDHYYITKYGMYFGIEYDGYIHT